MVIIKSTSTYECYTSNSAKCNIYLNSPSIHKDTTSYNFISNSYESNAPSIYN